MPPKAKSNDLSHVKAAESYVKDVISGKIPACKWVRLTCERHARDMEAAKSDAFPYVFDPEEARKACKFVSLMPHTKGDWSFFDRDKGHWNRIVMEPWQCFIVGSVFGWVKKINGKRRFRKARVFVPRKNAKTALMAAIGLYMLLYDNEPGAEVYCGATSKAQAMEVFKTSRMMLLKSPNLVKAKGITINVESIVLPDGSKFEPVIGKPGDGSSPHCSITDEYHEHPSSEMLDTMETGMGARSQPVSFVISTAGNNPSGPCRTEWQQCERVLSNNSGFVDDTYFAIIYTIDEGDSWESLDSVIKANPNYGVSIYEEGIEAELNEAKNTPSEQTKYKTKKLNLWVSVKAAYFNLARWEELAKPKIKREDYKDFPSYLGVDFSVKHDLTVIMQLFCLPDREYALFGDYYLPEKTIGLPENQHYRTWRIMKRLQEAGDCVVDYRVVEERLTEICGAYQVIEIPSDPWHGWQLLRDLTERGLPIVEYRNHVQTMSEPMKELDALIRSGRIIHDGDPILAWAIGNVTAKEDKKGCVFPNKDSSANKIDPVTASIMALGRAMTRDPEPNGPLIYF